ncbi:7alpha-cephem-methoxylase P8 chain related protein [Metarhizium brunneum]
MTTSVFRYIDSSSIQDGGWRAWTKVDSDVTCYKRTQRRRCVTNIRTWKLQFGTDISVFDVFDSPATEKSFTDDVAVRTSYYAEVESLLGLNYPV